MAKGSTHFGENMRNVHIRSKAFVFVGILMLGFAAFSFWGLSTQNSDLLLKIEQLEDNVKIGSRKQMDLEDELQSFRKKNNDLQKSNAKLQADLAKKEKLIDAQGGEAAQWRDKVRDTEAEIERLKSQVSEKRKELTDMQKQLSLKESKLQEDQDIINKLKSQVGSAGNQPLKLVNGTTSTSAQPGLVLAKPHEEKPDHDDDAKIPDRIKDEPVGAKPDEEDAVKAEDEMELVDEKKFGGVIDQPGADNDEAKFNQIRAEMEVADDVGDDRKDVGADGGSKEANNADNHAVIKEPNLLNSENLDDEPEPGLADANPRFHNFNPKLKNDAQRVDDNNLPEDQEIENDHDDDRGEQ